MKLATNERFAAASPMRLEASPPTSPGIATVAVARYSWGCVSTRPTVTAAATSGASSSSDRRRRTIFR